MRRDPTRTLKADAIALAEAARIFLKGRENQDPYALDRHREGCPEPDIWIDGETLVLEDELNDAGFYSCSCCGHQYLLWAEIIDTCGSAEYGRRAQAAFQLEDFIEDFHPDMSTIDALDYADLRIVKAERARVEAERTYLREQEAKANKQ